MCPGLGRLEDLEATSHHSIWSPVLGTLVNGPLFLSLFASPFLNLAGLQRSTPWKVSDASRSLGVVDQLLGVLEVPSPAHVGGPREGCLVVLLAALAPPLTCSLFLVCWGELPGRASPSTACPQHFCPPACLLPWEETRWGVELEGRAEESHISRND